MSEWRQFINVLTGRSEEDDQTPVVETEENLFDENSIVLS